MPLGKGVRYRVKHTKKGPVRLAFKGDKVVEATKLRDRDDAPSIRHLKRRTRRA